MSFWKSIALLTLILFLNNSHNQQHCYPPPWREECAHDKKECSLVFNHKMAATDRLSTCVLIFIYLFLSQIISSCSRDALFSHEVLSPVWLWKLAQHCSPFNRNIFTLQSQFKCIYTAPVHRLSHDNFICRVSLYDLPSFINSIINC